MTVLVLERHPVDPERMAAFEGLVGELLVVMRAAAGALWADIGRVTDEDMSYLLVSEWRSAADADAWDQGAEAARFAAQADVLLRAEPSRRRFHSA